MFMIRSFTAHCSCQLNGELLNGIQKCFSTSAHKNCEIIFKVQQSQLNGQIFNTELKHKNGDYENRHSNEKLNNPGVSSKKYPPITDNELLPVPFISREQTKEFMAIYPDIVQELTEYRKQLKIPEETIERINNAIQYTVPTGKKFRGLITFIGYQMLEKPELLTSENIRLSKILGWCVELINAFLLSVDDIMDGSVMRRGELCWYRQPGIGLSGINETMILQQDVYFLLKKHFSHHPSYTALMEVLHNATLETSLGQNMDLLCSAKNGTAKLHMFSKEFYKSLLLFKTCPTSFIQPVMLAMCLANITDRALYKEATAVLVELTEFYQAQNDFVDCFTNKSVSGKIGNDIQEGKCTWFAVTALEKATPAQRKIMEDHYGKSESGSVAIIRQLYEDLGLREAYAKYEKESYKMTAAHIQQMSKKLPHDLFIKILNMVYEMHKKSYYNIL